MTSHKMSKNSESRASTSTTSSMPPSSSSPARMQQQHHVVKYNLHRGHPNMNLLPYSEMQSIMSTYFLPHDNNNDESESDSWREYLNYGANAGDTRFRLALRSFLDKRTMMDDDHGNGGGMGNNKPREDFATTTLTASSSSAALAERDGDGLKYELFITNGVSHGLELLCATCTQPGDEVWVERPTYFLAPNIFESHGLVVKSLPMVSDRSDIDNIDDGITNNDYIGRVNIDRLIQKVEEMNVPAPKMIYIIPSYHNPTGRSMSVEERRKLATFALRNRVMLVADEVYHLLDWEQNNDDDDNHDDDEQVNIAKKESEVTTSRRPAGIVHFNERICCDEASSVPTQSDDQSDTTTKSDGYSNETVGCCISVSSFTKIWAPGIRLGWIDAPSFIVERLENYGYIDSQMGVAPFMGAMMTRAIESGVLDDYLDKLKLEYAERYRLVYNLLKEGEPRRMKIRQNSHVRRQGGYFIWVEFPSHVNSDDFLSYSVEHFGVKFMAGGRCDPFPLSNGGGDNDNTGIAIRSCARLCFADLDRDDLIDAMTAFLEAFRSYMSSLSSQ